MTGAKVSNVMKIKATVSLFLLLITCSVCAQKNDAERRAWNRPVKPFRLIGNIYYVGAEGVASYLITTPNGHILLDGGFEETVPLIQDNLRLLGFKLTDVKILINSHAHFDHAGGLAELRRLTGASLIISEGDADQVRKGGKDDFAFEDRLLFQPATVDRTIRDNEKIELGGVILTARITPGHTKGCTTWIMKVREAHQDLNIVFLGSTTIPGYKLVGNPKYPNIAEDYARSFALLHSLECHVFLGPHGSFFSLQEKQRQLEQGVKQNPFIDPAGYRRFLNESETAYLKQLREEQQKGN